ncbi:MAG: hypothetical protein R3E53_08550 [Myxococcota bacterium]
MTDVGSVKASVVELIPGLLPAGVEFVGRIRWRAVICAGEHARAGSSSSARRSW